MIYREQKKKEEMYNAAIFKHLGFKILAKNEEISQCQIVTI